ncbi:MAG: 50S ribosomal protein L24 [Rhodobacteraceae bacterium]|nr:50S ribosomal protein L24 [Paracoccaceae bacterium]
MAAKLKTGDKVVVTTGRDKGVQGEIVSVDPKSRRAVVSGANLAIRHVKQTPTSQGGRQTKEMPIDLSNLMLLDPDKGGPTRVGFRFEDGKKVRFAKKSGAKIDV